MVMSGKPVSKRGISSYNNQLNGVFSEINLSNQQTTLQTSTNTLSYGCGNMSNKRGVFSQAHIERMKKFFCANIEKQTKDLAFQIVSNDKNTAL